MEPHPLVRLLHRLNRKERYWVVQKVSGWSPYQVPIDRSFLNALCAALAIDLHPHTARYVAVDYHLNWLIGAFVMLDELADESVVKGREFDMPSVQDEDVIRGNQEDIDLLLALEDKTGTLHLILAEAKYDGPWRESQLSSKAKRLRWLFEDHLPNIRAAQTIKGYFILLSRDDPYQNGVLKEEVRKGIRDLPATLLLERGPLWLPLEGETDGLVLRRTRQSQENLKRYKKFEV